VELFGLTCVAAYCAVASVVAVRLLRLADRTGEAPERWIGAALLLGGAVGYPGTIAASALAPSAPWLAERLGMAAILGLHLAAWANLLVWYLVFHPGRVAARRTVVMVSGLLLLAGAEGLASFDATAAGSAGRGTPAYLATLVCQALPYALTAVSGLHYVALLRRRIPLGLADPVVADRIFLWSLVAAVVVTQYAITLAQLAVFAPLGVTLPTVPVIAGLGLLLAVLLALAFVPPEPYLRWVEQRAGRPAEQG